ncbi:MAG: hypothetical protein Q8S27_05230 [Hoeflea sp.]|nr:hypothetical protein [Hoeflea sp.]
MRPIAVALLSLVFVTPVLAVEAFTYKGTLGKYPILVELAASSDGAFVGRYSYRANGGDIPLNSAGQSAASVLLTEEAPCTKDTCKQNDDGEVQDKPIGAHWTLTPSEDGATLTGTWQAAGKSGKPLAISLARVARRTLTDAVEITPYGLYDSAFPLIHARDGSFSAETAPYDFAKMDVEMQAGPEESLEASTFRYLTDPRSKFAFPRVVSLADGSSPDRVNQALEHRHFQISSQAFDCLSQIYAGFGATEYSAGMGPGTQGGYEDETIVMTYLSPRLVSWVESGSTWCGGAHPNNHSRSYALDARTGEPLAIAKVFKDWVATARATDDDDGSQIDQAAAMAAPADYYWAAGQPLIDHVVANRVPVGDADFEAECGIDELVATNLAVRFVPGDQVVFTLEDLPHAINACGEDLLTAKLSDIPQLLAPTAGTYFPALAN